MPGSPARSRLFLRAGSTPGTSTSPFEKPKSALELPLRSSRSPSPYFLESLPSSLHRELSENRKCPHQTPLRARRRVLRQVTTQPSRHVRTRRCPYDSHQHMILV